MLEDTTTKVETKSEPSRFEVLEDLLLPLVAREESDEDSDDEYYRYGDDDASLTLSKLIENISHGELMNSIKKPLRQTIDVAAADIIEKHADDALVDCVTVASDESDPAIITIPAEKPQALKLPLRYSTVYGLYESESFLPSALGVEGKGTVQDSQLRMSREALIVGADGTVAEHGPLASALPRVKLHGPLSTFDYPEAMQHIHQRLCPTADSIRAVPYKMIIYGPGDFFTVHVDTMYSAGQFGTISAMLPVAERAEDEKEAPSVGYRDPEEVCDSSCEGGLRIYPVSMVSSGNERLKDSSKRYLLQGRAWGVGRTSSENRGIVEVPGSLSQDCEPGPQQNVHFAAWLGDVPHEVTRLEHGFRVVITYQLHRSGKKLIDEWSAPYLEMQAQFQRILDTLDEFSALPELLKPRDEKSSYRGMKVADYEHASLQYDEVPAGGTLFDRFGVALRHHYPPLGLKPEMLKGVDAMVYAVLNRLRPVALFSGLEVSQDYDHVPFRSVNAPPPLDGKPVGYMSGWGDRTPFFRAVFPTTHSRMEIYEKVGWSPDKDTERLFEDSESEELIAAKYQALRLFPWMELGMGTNIGGGISYGNGDCETGWWYRRAYLVALNGPTLWQRRRDLFLITQRGPPGMQRIGAVEDVLREISTFL